MSDATFRSDLKDNALAIGASVWGRTKKVTVAVDSQFASGIISIAAVEGEIVEREVLRSSAHSQLEDSSPVVFTALRGRSVKIAGNIHNQRVLGIAALAFMS
jgi:hypothetical protein